MITVSVIVTTYNAEHTLERLIQSVFNQKGLDDQFEIEWLVVDDCSTDKTRTILKQYNIPFYQNEKNSGGPNLGRNKALMNATGDYITITDDDDEWMPDKILSLLNCAHQAPIVSSGYYLIDLQKENAIAIGQQHGNCSLYTKNETFQQILSRTYSGQTTYIGSLMFSSSIPIPEFEMSFGKADWDWVAKLFHNQESAEAGKLLYKRYIDGSNLSLNEQYRKEELENSLSYLQTQKDRYPDLVEKGIQNSYGSMARYYYSVGNMPKARMYFKKSKWTTKTILYYITSFVGYKLVNRYFKVFG